MVWTVARNLLLAGAIAWCGRAQKLELPNHSDSFRFAVIGDTGTGQRAQYEIGSRLAESRRLFKFEVVLMLGDNMYGRTDFERKFELPYKPLLEDGVGFYAILGNHDDPNQRQYKSFNMGGRRYYQFEPHPGVVLFGLDSSYMDKTQLDWFETELAKCRARWKIVYLHHPIYSSGARHGSDMQLRSILEPLLVKHRVSLVLAGHDHFYERIKPQRGVHYFVVGGSAKVRKGNVRKTEFTVKSFDTDTSYVLMEIAADKLHFQAISRTGATVDAGVLDPAGSS